MSLTSQAAVATPTPERYAKQLVAHLGRRLEFAEDAPGTWTVTVEGTTASVAVGDGLLNLSVRAADEADLARFESVLGSHLERFGRRNELVVAWHRAAA